MVKKSPEETLELLKKRRQEFEGYEERLKDFYNSLANQLNEIENLMRQQNV
jgi:prefoldin subunit 5